MFKGGIPLVAAALIAALPIAARAAALEPYQMVRSLQIVQDRIAGGDHAALPMQSKLLEMIDQRLRTIDTDAMQDRRNLEAALIYGMSGGNPITVEALLSRIGAPDTEGLMAKGIAEYLRGDLGRAMHTLHDIDPRALEPGIGAFLALIKGSLIAGEDPTSGLQLFDHARLLGPGTLIEEAALRRSLSATVKTGDAPRFLSATSQYVRRFLRSPYATQFADEFVRGIVALHATLDLVKVEETIREMTPEHQRVIYLRLARTSAIEGLSGLAEFAAAKAAGFEAAPAGPDARAILYSSLSTIATDESGTVLARLRSIDRTRLAPPDRQLLDAAIAIAAGVVRSPDGVPAPAPVAADVATPPRVVSLAPEVQPPPSPRVVLPGPAAAALPPPPPVAAPVAPPLASPEARPLAPPATVVSPPPVAGQPDEPEPSIVSETRRKLEDIDRLLNGAR